MLTAAAQDLSMSKPVVFISHISEEAKLAVALKTAIVCDFLSIPEVFVSSDTQSIGAGSNWLSSIEKALADAQVLLILCSSASIRRPWTHFEAGAAWMRKIPIIPVCHSGFHPHQLQMPLSVLQAVQANQAQGLKRIYSRIAEHLACAVPTTKFDTLLSEITNFEKSHAPAPEPLGDDSNRQDIAWKRMKEGLSDKEFKWRALDRLAILGGVSEDEALEILGKRGEVKFGKGKSGKRIVKIEPAG